MTKRKMSSFVLNPGNPLILEILVQTFFGLLYRSIFQTGSEELAFEVAKVQPELFLVLIVQTLSE